MTMFARSAPASVSGSSNGVDPLALDDDEDGSSVIAIDLPAPTAAAALAPPPAPPAPPPSFADGAPPVLAPSAPPEPKTRGKAKDVAARAFRATLLEEGGRADVHAPVEPYDLPPAMTEAEIVSLHAAAEEVTLEGELGRLTLVRAYTDQKRQELTYRDAACLRTLVQIFPGARVVAIRKPTSPEPERDVSAEGAAPSAVPIELSDAAEPPEDPLDLGEALDFPGPGAEPDPFE
jgi:hypothetical protein